MDIGPHIDYFTRPWDPFPASTGWSWRACMSGALRVTLRGGLIFLLLLPLVITPQTLFPSLFGKALYAPGPN